MEVLEYDDSLAATVKWLKESMREAITLRGLFEITAFVSFMASTGALMLIIGAAVGAL